MVLVAGSCTGNFEEYNTNQFQIHEAEPSTLMKSMIETIVNIQQNDSQMMDQMVGQLGGYLTCANVWSGTNFGTFNQSDAWNAGPWNTNFEKIYGNFFQIQEATNESGHYYAFARMIRALHCCPLFCRLSVLLQRDMYGNPGEFSGFAVIQQPVPGTIIKLQAGIDVGDPYSAEGILVACFQAFFQ